MLAIEDIEDALITDALVNINGIKTVETHEKEFNEQTLAALIPRAPFALIRYVETQPVESERNSDGSAGMKKRSFVLALGASSLRSKKEGQRGCYALLDSFRLRYDGFHLTVGGDNVALEYDGDSLIYSNNSIIVYAIMLSCNEN